jgi:hypothetical protein
MYKLLITLVFSCLWFSLKAHDHGHKRFLNEQLECIIKNQVPQPPVTGNRTPQPCTCSATTYEDGYELDLTISYTPFGGGSCGNPCGANNLELLLEVFDVGSNQTYTYTGTPNFGTIAFVCGASCRSEDWLYAQKENASNTNISIH